MVVIRIPVDLLIVLGVGVVVLSMTYRGHTLIDNMQNLSPFSVIPWPTLPLIHIWPATGNRR